MNSIKNNMPWILLLELAILYFIDRSAYKTIKVRIALHDKAHGVNGGSYGVVLGCSPELRSAQTLAQNPSFQTPEEIRRFVSKELGRELSRYRFYESVNISVCGVVTIELRGGGSSRYKTACLEFEDKLRIRGHASSIESTYRDCVKKLVLVFTPEIQQYDKENKDRIHATMEYITQANGVKLYY